MLLDEPFSSLDASLRASLRADVVRILREQGATTVLVTHDQSEALSVADVVGVLSTGRIRQFDSPETLYSHPAEPVIASFLGEANLVPGNASGGFVHTALGPLSLAGGAGSLTGLALALVRPEQISLRPLADGRGVPGLVAGRALQREYYGHDCVVLVGLDGLESHLRVRCLGNAPRGGGRRPGHQSGRRRDRLAGAGRRRRPELTRRTATGALRRSTVVLVRRPPRKPAVLSQSHL